MQRTFIYRHGPTETEFGSVDIAIEGDVLINGQTVGDNTMAHLIGYMAQSLQDTYAGVGKSKTVDEAQAAFDNRLKALLDDTVGVRTGGAVDDYTLATRVIARRVAKAHKKTDVLEAAKNDKSTLDEFFAKLWENEANRPALEAAVEARLNEMQVEREMAAKRKAQAAKLSVSID